MSKRHEARERKKGLRRTYAYSGPRYVVHSVFGHEPPQLLVRDSHPPQWYAVMDQLLRQDVGEPEPDMGVAEKRARELNDADH